MNDNKRTYTIPTGQTAKRQKLCNFYDTEFLPYTNSFERVTELPLAQPILFRDLDIEKWNRGINHLKETNETFYIISSINEMVYMVHRLGDQYFKIVFKFGKVILNMEIYENYE